MAIISNVLEGYFSACKAFMITLGYTTNEAAVQLVYKPYM